MANNEKLLDTTNLWKDATYPAPHWSDEDPTQPIPKRGKFYKRKRVRSHKFFSDIDRGNRIDKGFKSRRYFIKQSHLEKKFLDGESRGSFILRFLFSFSLIFIVIAMLLGTSFTGVIENYKIIMGSQNYSHSVEFYNYDWTYKLNQLKLFRPIFSEDESNVHINSLTYSPEEYVNYVQRLYDDNYFIFTDDGFKINYDTLDYNDENYVLAYEIYNFELVVDEWNMYDSNYNNDESLIFRPITSFKINLNHKVVPWGYNGRVFYRNWKNYYRFAINGSNSFGRTIIGVLLESPVNVTYNIIVCFIFLFDW